MRGLNQIVISGNVGKTIIYGNTTNGSAFCTFHLASDRYGSRGSVVTVWVKINLYGDDLARICRSRLAVGNYVLVSGELMNRSEGQFSDLVEVRAREIIFLPRAEDTSTSEEEVPHGSR